MTISLLCPNCGSNQTQSVDAIHSSGTSVGSARTTSFGTDYNGNFSQSSGVTSYGSSTLLATRVAPPKRPAYPSLSWAFCVLSVMGGIFLFWAANAQGITGSGMNTLRDYGTGACFIAIIFGIYAIIKTMNANENMPTWETDYSRWSKQRFCFSCSNIYTHRREFSSDTSYASSSQFPANCVIVKVIDNLVTFEQTKAYKSNPCTVFLGLKNGVKWRVGQTSPVAQTTLKSGEYEYSLQVDGLSLRMGTLSIAEKESPKEAAPALEYKEEDLNKALAQLKQAGDMLKDGIITKDEFDKMKSKIIQ